MSQARKYDIVVFGATGFTGSLCCEHIAKFHGDKVAWAVAGRSKSKLDSLVAGLPANSKGMKPEIVVADSMDEPAIEQMCKQTRVVLATAGPFSKFGSHVVASCAKHGTHYCDITGETMWVKSMAAKHDSTAKKTGAIIVPFCGYDCVPSDLGAFFVVSHLKDKLRKHCGNVRCLVGPCLGMASGGTMQTALGIVAQVLSSPRELFRAVSDPYYLGGPRGKDRTPCSLLPSASWRGRAVTAFWPLGLANTQVVRQSAGSLGYGPEFSYDEAMAFGVSGPLSLLLGLLAALGMTLGTTLAPLFAFPPLNWLVPTSGFGPSEALRKRGFFQHRVWAEESGGGSGRVEVVGKVTGNEDPGYGSTSKMVAEAAMALATEGKRLPASGREGGFLSPATAMGRVLVERLEEFAGMRFEIVSETAGGKSLK